MLSESIIESLARDFYDAERERSQVRAPTLRHPDLAMTDAYAIQRAWVNMKIAAGNPLKGYKIGLTSRAMQMSVGIEEPDHGVLLEDMFFEDGSKIPTSRFIAPRLEVELAFILGRPLQGPNVTLFDVLDATRYVIPALEIIDSRAFMSDPESGYKRKVLDTIADNAANAGIVMGGRPVQPNAVDLRWVCAVLSQNGAVEETGVAAGVLNHPANSVAWLANRLASYGIAMEAGQVILSGSFTRPIFVHANDTVTADYGPLGSVSCHFN